MKKYILTLIFTLSIISIGAFAQTISYGVKAGINLADLGSSDEKLTALSVGAILDIGLDGMSIQPGLFYTVKGHRDSFQKVTPGSSGGVISPIQGSPVHYLEVPVNLLFDIKIAKPIKMQLGFGPYFAYNIGNDDGYYTYTKTDIGANLIAGFVISNKFIVNVQYGIGITDAVQGGGANRVTSFSVGYLFK